MNPLSGNEEIAVAVAVVVAILIICVIVISLVDDIKKNRRNK